MDGSPSAGCQGGIFVILKSIILDLSKRGALMHFAASLLFS